MRARDLGVVIGQLPTGRLNAITDVAGVRVGHRTVIRGDAVRTGVTVILPHDGDPGAEPVFAASHTLNGNGEMTGLEWIRDAGQLTSPIALTNTNSVGAMHHALVGVSVRRRTEGLRSGPAWSLPVVAETWDGYLNDIGGQHLTRGRPDRRAGRGRGRAGRRGQRRRRHRHEAFGFKAGIGTASRMVGDEDGGYTVGALVQANFGMRERLMIDGVPVGREITKVRYPGPDPGSGGGSVIVILWRRTPAAGPPVPAAGAAGDAGRGPHRRRW